MEIQVTLDVARKMAGLTQKEAADIVGVHPQTIAKYENDSSDIPLSLMNKLCETYNMPKDNIFFGERVRK